MRKRYLTATALAAVFAVTPAAAQTAEEFFKGKTVNVYVGVSPGGIYSTFAQILTKHMPKYMPGNPTMIVQHMRGAGGTKAVNYIYNVAPKDGTYILAPNAGVTKRVVLGIGNPKYDPRKLHWLGGWGEAVNTITLRADAPAKTLQEAMQKEVVLGAIGKSSNTFMMPSLMNNIVGTKFKIITGYKGGSPIRKAIESGELHGWSGQWLGWKLRKPDWVRDKKIVNLVQMASKRSPDLPDVPLLSDFAKNDDEREMFTFVQTAIGDRALVAPPGVPEDRLAAIETAYMQTLDDPDFRKDAAARSYTIDPIKGADITAFVNRVMAMSPEKIDRLRTAMGLTPKK